MRRLILLLSVGWLPPSVLPSGACLALGASLLYKPPNAAEDSTTPGLRLCRCTLEHLAELNSPQGCVTSRGVRSLHRAGHLLGHGPQEASQCAGHGDCHHIGMFASGDEASVALTEPPLRCPTDVLDALGLGCESQLQMAADLGGITIRPGAFDQDAAGMGVACLGDRSLAALRPGGRFRGHEPPKLHPFPWACKAWQVPYCCHQGASHCQLPSTQGLESLNHRGHTPGFDVLVAFLCKTLEACGMLLHRTDVFLKDDVLRQAGRRPPRATAQQS